MKALTKTTVFSNGVDSHYHIIYLNQDAQAGITSQAADHAHQVIFQPAQPAQPEQPPQQDPTTGQMIQGVPAQDAIPEKWIIQPSPIDGHTHDVDQYKTTNPQRTNEPESKTVQDVITLFKTAREIESDSLKNAEESERFCEGDQWEPEARRFLEEQRRACLTINYVGKYVDDIVGHQRQNRTDFSFLPTEDGDAIVADLLNVIVKQITDKCYYPREESKVFEDAVQGGRGNFNIYVDTDEDLRGVIKVEKFNNKHIAYGPHEKEDLSDCEYLVKHKMYSRQKFEQLWPDKVDEVTKVFDFIESTAEHNRATPDQYAQSDNTPIPVSIIGTDQLIDVAKKELRLLECWRKVYIMCPIVVNVEQNFYFNAYGWSKQDLASIKLMPNFKIVNRTLTKMRITKVGGNTLLSDEYPANLPLQDFYVVPVYAKKRENRFWGKVESAKDPQREINKRRSQAMDIGNKMVNYGWLYDATTFPEGEKEKFKNKVNTPGFVAEVTDVNNPPKQMEGTKFPSEFVQLMNSDLEHLSMLMSTTVSEPGANTSGQALLQAERSKLTGSEFLFDNLSFAKKKVGTLLIGLIQRFYSPERILRLVKNVHAKEPIKIGDKMFDEFDEQYILDLLQTNDLAQYDVTIDESTYSPTVKLANFVMLKEMQGQGAPIPPDVLIEASPTMPKAQKEQILQSLQAQTDAQAQADSAKGDAELEKTLVAQGIIPPAVRERMGLDPSQQITPKGQVASPALNGFNPTDQNTLTG